MQSVDTLKQFIKDSCRKKSVSLPKSFDSFEIDLSKARIRPDWLLDFKKLCNNRGFTSLAKEYLGSQVAYQVSCNTCANEWPIKRGNLMLGRGCPKCYKSRRSQAALKASKK